MNKLLILAVLFVVSSCVTNKDLSYRYYGSQQRSPKNPKAVQILFGKPVIAYESVADFQGRGSNELIKQFQQKAAEVGADAIIVTTSNEGYSYDTEWAGDGIVKANTFEAFENRRVFGTAIIYTNTEGKK